ncbi:phage polarity suppression protein [uncultured Pantoea sp.]
MTSTITFVSSQAIRQLGCKEGFDVKKWEINQAAGRYIR